MEQVVIYTASFGGYDRLRHFEAPKARCVYITDTNMSVPGWELWKPTRRFPDDPVRESDLYKWLPHLWFPRSATTIWLDSNIVLKTTVDKMLSCLNGNYIALHAHPHRDCLYDEAAVVRNDRRITKTQQQQQLIDDQVAEYRALGYPAHNGLAETNVLIRHTSGLVGRLNEAVYIELSRYSQRDQLCFNYLIWKLGMQYGVLPGNARISPDFCYYPHGQ